MTSAADGRVQWRVTARADGTHTFGMLVLFHERDGDDDRRELALAAPYESEAPDVPLTLVVHADDAVELQAELRVLDGGGALRAFVRARGPLLAVTRDRDGVRATDLPVAAASPHVHVTPS